jgi:hypothetical protein
MFFLIKIYLINLKYTILNFLHMYLNFRFNDKYDCQINSKFKYLTGIYKTK